MSEEDANKKLDGDAANLASGQSFTHVPARFFAEQTAAMAMMTAFGMGVTSRMTGMFLGAMADAMEKLPRDNARARESAAEPVVGKKATIHQKDDLKRISGIGPKLEKTLNGMGIGEFSQIASWTGADAKKIDTDLVLSNRIIRDDWVGQAKKLLES